MARRLQARNLRWVFQHMVDDQRAAPLLHPRISRSASRNASKKQRKIMILLETNTRQWTRECHGVFLPWSSTVQSASFIYLPVQSSRRIASENVSRGEIFVWELCAGTRCSAEYAKQKDGQWVSRSRKIGKEKQRRPHTICEGSNIASNKQNISRNECGRTQVALQLVQTTWWSSTANNKKLAHHKIRWNSCARRSAATTNAGRSA